jgi:hypothetical protein
MKFFLLTLISLTSLAAPFIAGAGTPDPACQVIYDEIQSIARMKELVSQYPKAHVYQMVKDQPILAYRITGTRFADLPEWVRRHMGEIDTAKYPPEAQAAYQHSVISLQLKDGKPDFYPQELSHVTEKYVEVGRAEVEQKNPKLLKALLATEAAPYLQSNDPNIIALLKTEVVPMVRMSQVGFDKNKEVTIQPPWEGTQTKPAGADAFLYYEAPKDAYYMINTDARGLGAGYILHRPPGTLSAEFVADTIRHSEAPVHRFKKVRGAGFATRAVYEMYKMSELGLPEHHEIAIQGPFGKQEKPKGFDGYLTREITSGQFYLVISGANGLPFGFEAVK